MFLITRSRQESLKVVTKLENAGLSVLTEPMLQIEQLSVDILLRSLWHEIDTIIITSRHAVAALANHPADSKRFLVVGPKVKYAVAKLLAEGCIDSEYRKMGMVITLDNGQRDVNAIKSFHYAAELVDHIKVSGKKAIGRCLYLRGREVNFDISNELSQNGFICREVVSYYAHTALAFSDTLLNNLQFIRYVLFYSKRSAEIFHRLLGKEDGYMDFLGTVTAVALSPAIAANLPKYQHVITPEYPEEDSLLQVLDVACK